MNKKKKGKGKKPVYEPYSRLYKQDAFFDDESLCPGSEAEMPDLGAMSLEELEALRAEYEEAISDWDMIIYDTLEGTWTVEIDLDGLASDRRKRQQLTVELREVKAQIKLMKKMVKKQAEELSVA